MYTKSYDILCIAETWLNDTIYDSEILPCNYKIHRKDRNSRGGGINLIGRKWATYPV